jgi:hypothetical protein
MPTPPRLTLQQKHRLHVLEPALREAARRGDYETAKGSAVAIQELLRPTGHESRLMQAKNWLFEAAMGAGHLQMAESGFVGIRKKTSGTSRLYLEATALLAICYLRQKKLSEAEPLIAQVLKSRNIRSESGRRRFLRHIVGRFEEEGLLGALRSAGTEPLDVDEIQELAASLVQTKNEDEILFEMGAALPAEVIAFLLKVDAMAKRGLTAKEILYLPGESQILERSELGRTTFRSFKRVLWRSLCDPTSEVYKAWFSQGLACVLDRKYYAIAVSAMLVDLGIGIKALAVSATALVIKFGLEVYCDRFKPDFVMDGRDSR